MLEREYQEVLGNNEEESKLGNMLASLKSLTLLISDPKYKNTEGSNKAEEKEKKSLTWKELIYLVICIER